MQNKSLQVKLLQSEVVPEDALGMKLFSMYVAQDVVKINIYKEI